MPTRRTKSGRVVAVPIDTGLCYGSGMRVFTTHKGRCPKCGRDDVETVYPYHNNLGYYAKHQRPDPLPPETLETLEKQNGIEPLETDCPF